MNVRGAGEGAHQQGREAQGDGGPQAQKDAGEAGQGRAERTPHSPPPIAVLLTQLLYLLELTPHIDDDLQGEGQL